MRPTRSLGGTLQRGLLILFALTALVASLLFGFKDKIALGAEVYLYGYPLVIMDITRARSELLIGPENELRRVRQFPDANFKDVVRPNLDTLYSTAFISMKQGPWVFEMPHHTTRYELMPFMDAWTNVFASPGTRKREGQSEIYLLAGPTWQGKAPEGMTLLKSPTDMVWLIGRTQTNGTADFETVHRLQDGLQLYPLNRSSAASTNNHPATKEGGFAHLPPVIQMREISTSDFLVRLMQLMVDNPPSVQDAPMMKRLVSAGLIPGKPVHLSRLETAIFTFGRWIANQKISRALSAKTSDGTWQVPPLNLGQYGSDYNTRAAVAMVGLGANLPEDAIYPNTSLDHQGQTLTGQHRYQIHFEADKLPPVKAFWSITAYGADEFLIDNPIKRYALGDRDALAYNADRSLDIWIQAKPPVAQTQQKNWLPVKDGASFLLNARLYWPHASALQGHWQMPLVRRLD